MKKHLIKYVVTGLFIAALGSFGTLYAQSQGQGTTLESISEINWITRKFT